MNLTSPLLVAPPFGGGAGVYPDVVAAIRGTLGADATLAASFGDGPTTAKFLTAPAIGGPALPYLVIEELDGLEAAQTADDAGEIFYDNHVEYRVSVFASGMLAARDLRRDVARVLTDAPLRNSDREVLYFRPSGTSYPVVPDVAPGAPQAYRAVLTFSAILDGTY